MDSRVRRIGIRPCHERAKTPTIYADTARLRFPVNERRIRQIFDISLLLKGLHALVETAGGIALYLVSTNTIVALVNAATQEELIEDPNDFVATHLLSMAQHFSVATKSFYAFYLFGHGLIKVWLVVGLFRNRLWSYPASLIALTGFIAYQLYRYSYTHSVGLMLLTLFDLFVIALIWHEWRLIRRVSTSVGE
jgi:uncharacterized membrane protein